MKVLIDTNIMLDGLLEREPFNEDARALFQAIDLGQIQGYVTATTLTDIFYIVRKQTQSLERARLAVIETLEVMEVCLVDHLRLERAIASNLRDFEDALQLACAIADRLDAIVTRDSQGFAGATLPILFVSELRDRLSPALD
ncbi:PIN domain-containing protein [Coleofasciculus sp. FACHB-1120]|uniref:PIN domain-containing protein n=1 Tax=Coleofasciculus sp. FACHB-1120 TaxID=2692783 RepID=UPI001688FCED|nr:PIN domain-containing protein [Coleofasciculus sp. FACHB-1120]MBD2741207.1 PIN domain-containing protein [Coleofasciculus sp. FACHB-1120]